jgi:hypothetical protein
VTSLYLFTRHMINKYIAMWFNVVYYAINVYYAYIQGEIYICTTTYMGFDEVHVCYCMIIHLHQPSTGIWKSKIILTHRDRDFILYVKFLCMLFDFMTILISQCFKVRLVFTISVVWITTIFLFCNFLWNHFSSNSGQAVNSTSTPKTKKKKHKEKRGAINLSWK